MKVQIRRGVFETNSSSTHTLCIYNGSDWDRFVKGEMVIGFSCYHPELVEVTEGIKDRIYDPESDDNIYDSDYLTYEVWSDIWNYADEGWEALEENVADKHVVSFYQSE